ncbi:Endoglucanase 2 [Zea mays]|uniref:Endoglucanase n=1 Tax=Zea mays TaxID=4577 RepID=A0A3L6EW83_MAIZE|nr:Endoglucanase 2 [Zea mays]
MAGYSMAAVALAGIALALAAATTTQLVSATGGHDYREALSKSILYFEAQRSGRLPGSQRVAWRADSGLLDGKANGVDLVGGYYDAGDNVKFGLPMAFTVTMMSWSVIEYGDQMAAPASSATPPTPSSGARTTWSRRTRSLTCCTERSVLFSVGDGDSDHDCWMRPEDMTTSRQAYRLDPQNPGSELAGETAAAMAAASLVFRSSNPGYANTLLQHSKQQHHGGAPVLRLVQRVRGRAAVGAAWLHEATGDARYLDYLANNADALGGTGWSINQFGWDVKYPGVQVLAAMTLLRPRGDAGAGAHADVLRRYKQQADLFACSCLGRGGPNSVRRTPGGMAARCPAGGTAQPSELLAFARSQVDYILGSNPRATSYMVGYGATYPRQVHHRGASIVSVRANPSFVSCQAGYSSWYHRRAANPNLIVGATVGRPDEYDNFADERDNYEQTEATTYNNARSWACSLDWLPVTAVAVASLVITSPPMVKVSSSTSINDTNRTSLPSPSPDSEHPSAWPIEIEQNTTASWTKQGKTYRRYAVTVTNRSPKTVHELHIGISKLYGQVWALTRRGTATCSRAGYRRCSPARAPCSSTSRLRHRPTSGHRLQAHLRWRPVVNVLS